MLKPKFLSSRSEWGNSITPQPTGTSLSAQCLLRKGKPESLKTWCIENVQRFRSSLLSTDCTAQDTEEFSQSLFLLLPPPQGCPLLVQLGPAQCLQVHPRVCLTWPVLLEYCEQWAGCSTPSKGARPPLASTEASLAPWGSFQHPYAGGQALGFASTGPAWTLCCVMVKILEIVLASMDSSTLQHTWEQGEFYEPDMGHPTF